MYINQIINMPLHDLSWYPTCVQSFSPVPFTVFELQGLKLKNNNNNNKNCTNELSLIFHTSPIQILSYYRYLRHSYPVVVKDVDSH